MKKERWKRVRNLFGGDNSIGMFIDTFNEYGLEFAQWIFGKQVKLIRYLDKKEKEIKENKSIFS